MSETEYSLLCSSNFVSASSRILRPAPISPNERLAAFGRGVLSNRGSFLDNLSAGLASQQQAEAARRRRRPQIC